MFTPAASAAGSLSRIDAQARPGLLATWTSASRNMIATTTITCSGSTRCPHRANDGRRTGVRAAWSESPVGRAAGEAARRRSGSRSRPRTMVVAPANISVISAK